MIRVALVLGLIGSALSPVMADEAITVSTCLRDGYDVRAAFSDNNGGAYLVMQKGASAYMCHSNPSPRCEKLN